MNLFITKFINKNYLSAAISAVILATNYSYYRYRYQTYTDCQPLLSPPLPPPQPMIIRRTLMTWAGSNPHIDDLFQQNRSSVVYVVPQNRDQLDCDTFGTGFIVQCDDPDNCLVITNYHVCYDSPVVGVKFAVNYTNGDILRDIDPQSMNEPLTYLWSQVVYVEPYRDLVLVRLPPVKLDLLWALRLANNEPEIGDWFILLGHGDIANSFKYGIVAHPNHPMEYERGLLGQSSEIVFAMNYLQLQIVTQITPGYSGGPVLNMNGEVIGVCFGRRMPKMSQAIKLTDIKDFLELAELYDMSLNSENLVNQRRYRFSKSIGVVVKYDNHSYTVRGYAPNAILVKNHLLPNDRIIGINDMAIQSKYHLRQAVKEWETVDYDNSPGIKLRVMRNNQGLDVYVKPEILRHLFY
ncbi:serine protease HTRA2, mitochondrial-like [Oppia nitens]|uniref:serine protease HTRA2, mitochondrial-like n=1 Tax=Oppia nitens TaxID=1686743 RepID=UPI0023DC203A|nr:serine protease HTRA2, mitochondrial-like [Oppia nitens]